ncbi:hypothetical protein [Streptomyces sp. NPDC087300]|uniref:hypothetical protein n=1 Tax=Streptomyces sp. NPDC087300 TaxID=3365780 RepID=UPI00382AFF5F
MTTREDLDAYIHDLTRWQVIEWSRIEEQKDGTLTVVFKGWDGTSVLTAEQFSCYAMGAIDAVHRPRPRRRRRIV